MLELFRTSGFVVPVLACVMALAVFMMIVSVYYNFKYYNNKKAIKNILTCPMNITLAVQIVLIVYIGLAL